MAMEDAGDGDDWLVSHLVKESNLEEEFDILDNEGEIIEKVAEKTESGAANDEADEYQDMEGFEDDDILVDDAAAATSATQEQESNLLKTRTVRIDCHQRTINMKMELFQFLMAVLFVRLVRFIDYLRQVLLCAPRLDGWKERRRASTFREGNDGGCYQRLCKSNRYN